MQRYLPQPDLPKVRRIVTGHTVDGRSIFEHDEQITPVSTAGASGGSKSFAAGFSLIHKSCGHPVGLQGGREELAVENLRRSAGDGIVCEVVDFPPGRLNQDVFMHRNSSLDYMVILKGSILAVLDGGAEKTLNEGDILVQRGTYHGWKNISGSFCRFMVVIVPSEQVKVEATGATLEVTKIPGLTD